MAADDGDDGDRDSVETANQQHASPLQTSGLMHSEEAMEFVSPGGASATSTDLFAQWRAEREQKKRKRRVRQARYLTDVEADAGAHADTEEGSSPVALAESLQLTSPVRDASSSPLRKKGSKEF